MAAKAPVVFYRYDGSPFAEKISNVLFLKGIPHHRVDVSMTMPRPELSELLGIAYRRIPVLAIGNDVYCDTSLIVSILERVYPQQKGYSTLFPMRKGGGKADTGMIKAFVMFYVDRPLFELGASVLPYNKFKPEFIKDRSTFLGPIDINAKLAEQPVVKSLISSHLTLLEEQLADGREWLFDTEQPSYADISVYFFYGWIVVFRGVSEIITPVKFPQSVAWLKRITEFVKQKKAAAPDLFTKIKGDEAAALIDKSASVVVGFDEDEAARLAVKKGEQVSVAPTDTGRTFLTQGKLVGLNREEVVIETRGSAAKVKCHFPRLNFKITPIPSGKL